MSQLGGGRHDPEGGTVAPHHVCRRLEHVVIVDRHGRDDRRQLGDPLRRLVSEHYRLSRRRPGSDPVNGGQLSRGNGRADRGAARGRRRRRRRVRNRSRHHMHVFAKGLYAVVVLSPSTSHVGKVGYDSMKEET